MPAEKIIAAALEAFAQRGYDGASLAEIAKGAGIRKPSIYAHFAGKKELFMAILTRACEREKERLELLRQPGLARLRIYLFDILKRHACDWQPLFWLRALYLPPAGLAHEIRTVDEGYVEKLDAAIRESIAGICEAPDFAATLVHAYAGIVRGVHAELLYHGPERALLKAEAMWRVFELAAGSSARRSSPT